MSTSRPNQNQMAQCSLTYLSQMGISITWRARTLSDSHKTVSWVKAKILCLSQLLEGLDLDKLWPMALFVGCKHNSTMDLLYGHTPIQYINFWLLMISQTIFTSRRLHGWSVHLLGPTMDVVYLRDFVIFSNLCMVVYGPCQKGLGRIQPSCTGCGLPHKPLAIQHG